MADFVKMVVACLLVAACVQLGFGTFQDSASHPPGVIAGRVVDDDGRPMRGVRVRALVRASRDGPSEMTPRGNTSTTNDRGEFRLFWLEPGAYYILINPIPPLDPPRILMRSRGGLEYIPSDPEASF